MTRDELDEDYVSPSHSQEETPTSAPGKNALHDMALAVTKSAKKIKIVLTKAEKERLEEKRQAKEDLMKEHKSVKGKKSVKSIKAQREERADDGEPKKTK